MSLLGAALRMLQQATPANPGANTNAFYFKTDGKPYYMGPDGVERPFIPVPTALHQNPTFDAATGGKTDLWSEQWLSGGAVMSSDSTNVVAGLSMKVTAGNGLGSRMINTNAFTVSDTQTVNFSVWAKAIGSTTNLEIGMISNTTAATANFFQTGAIFSNRTVPLTSTFTRYTGAFTVPAGHLFARFSLYPNSLAPTWSSDVYFDESDSSAETIQSSPIGAVTQFAGTTAPSGWLVCDGSAVDRTTYAALFALVSTVYGAGNGSSTFNLPDLRGRIAIGVGTGFNLGGNENAAESARNARFEHRHTHADLVHAHNNASLQLIDGGSHTHNIPLTGNNTTTATGSTVRVVTVGGASYPFSADGVTGTAGAGHTHGGITGATANSAAGQTDQQGVGGQNAGIATHPYQALNYIIKAL